MSANPAEFPALAGIFQNLINATFALAGLACFVFILVGAFRYLNSGGDDKAVQAAKNTLTFAIIVVLKIHQHKGTLFIESLPYFIHLTRQSADHAIKLKLQQNGCRFRGSNA